MRRTPLHRYKGFEKSSNPNYRHPLRFSSLAPIAVLKRQIQALLREIVIKRDGGCFVRSLRLCGANSASGAILQADHLITRASSATFADSRLVVCVCKLCHFWKKWHKEEYDRIVRSLLPADRVELWERADLTRYHPTRKDRYDWKLAIVALKQELRRIQ